MPCLLAQPCSRNALQLRKGNSIALQLRKGNSIAWVLLGDAVAKAAEARSCYEQAEAMRRCSAEEGYAAEAAVFQLAAAQFASAASDLNDAIHGAPLLHAILWRISKCHTEGDLDC